MKATLDLIVEHYGLRLTTAELARVLKTSPANIRKEISAETFPIPTYKDRPTRRAPRFADARDVAEYLDRDMVLKELDLILSRRIVFKVISAVYFLFDKRKLIYIGQTVNLFDRLESHRQKKAFTWNSYAFIETHPEDLINLERLYIKKLNPPCNKQICHGRVGSAPISR